MAIVSTYGDVKGFTTSALIGLGATEADANGRFYLDVQSKRQPSMHCCKAV